jgi:squalene-hopene/tetraprenyl-beta-curcumene cyclase
VATPPAEQPAAPEPTPAEAAAPDAASLARNREEAIQRGIAYLTGEQAEDGSWAKGNIGITALCTQALLAGGKTIQDPPVRKAVEFLAKHQADDGGIRDVGLENYTTSVALMVLVKADPKTYAPQIEKAKAFLIAHQWDEAESIDTGHPWYGGAGYGQHERPDLSNEAFFLEAMHQAGVPKDHPLWKKAQVFLSRTQDRSESNDGVFVGTDGGGFVYSPHGGGESKAGTVDLPNGKKGLKAYGTMTYAGFKSFVYAGLSRDDPRVLAALDWIRRHWTFDENPELGQQGLFYYYLTAARALSAWGEPTIMDVRRRTHDWRAELSDSILRRQRENGSWFNEAERWFEGEQVPVVPTSYCIIALVECRQPTTSGENPD